MLIYANEFCDVIPSFSSLERYRNSNHCKIIIGRLFTLMHCGLTGDSSGV